LRLDVIPAGGPEQGFGHVRLYEGRALAEPTHEDRCRQEDDVPGESDHDAPEEDRKLTGPWWRLREPRRTPSPPSHPSLSVGPNRPRVKVCRPAVRPPGLRGRGRASSPSMRRRPGRTTVPWARLGCRRPGSPGRGAEPETPSGCLSLGFASSDTMDGACGRDELPDKFESRGRLQTRGERWTAAGPNAGRFSDRGSSWATA
jgi:hypothetical protein